MTLIDASYWATIAQAVLLLISLFGGSFFVFGYVRKMRPVWKRFTTNVARQISVISTEKQPMEHEVELLSRVGYFKNVKHIASDTRNINLLRETTLIVVGYTENSKMYKAVLKYAFDNTLPIIVFASKDMNKDDFNEIKNYSFGSICNTDLRLVSDVFSVMSTFPESKS
ncbi:MAG: hypothetical protein Q7T41_01245 [Candidatus Saccharibacteria bacterium]|nr:hypothetical protein [Candidatus Saccharibacteria bacterium]